MELWKNATSNTLALKEGENILHPYRGNKTRYSRGIVKMRLPKTSEIQNILCPELGYTNGSLISLTTFTLFPKAVRQASQDSRRGFAWEMYEL